MNETTLAFGANAGLVGTLSAAGPRAGGVAALLFNAGVVPRIGPNRLNVRIARALAASGIPAIRFDISGRGDSAPARGMESYEQQAVADIRAAMDLLNERTGARRFALMGICSGAENAFHAALADERVVGVTLMDSYHYPTLRTHLNRFQRRADMQGGLVRAGSAWLMRRLRGARKGRARNSVASSFGSIRPTPEAFAAQLRKLLDRGVKIDLLFSGSFLETYNYENQFRDGFGRFGIVERLHVEYRPDLDHTLSTAAMQRAMVERTTAWVSGLDAKPGQA
ncbi:MAG TPA: alpha/beta fold hydrolase [Steroidobacteraceae bacterium]|nr:alpha/beta fold hydrolase [Steroidobacteraceae bacterium]